MNGTRVHALWRQCSESLLNGHYLRLSVYFVARDILTRIWVGNILGFASSMTRFFGETERMNMLFLFTPKSGYQDDRALQYPESVYQHKTKKTRHFKPLTNLTPPPTPIPFTSFQYSGSTPFHSAIASQVGLAGLISAFFFLVLLGFNCSQTCFVSSIFLVQQYCNYPPTRVLRKMQLQSQDYNCPGLYFQRVLD